MRYYGFRGHLVIDSLGIITSIGISSANVDERDMSYEVAENFQGMLLGDKGYIRPELNKDMNLRGIDLQTSLRTNMADPRPKKFVKKLSGLRCLVETVISQLSERFHIEKVRARDTWHLLSRIWRKCLAHTIAVMANLMKGESALKFENMITI